MDHSLTISHIFNKKKVNYMVTRGNIHAHLSFIILIKLIKSGSSNLGLIRCWHVAPK
jgi:hypothetical protein